MKSNKKAVKGAIKSIVSYQTKYNEDYYKSKYGYDYAYEDDYSYGGYYTGCYGSNHTKVLSTKLDRIYIAYGSNMDLERMRTRCPHSEFMSKGVLKGYKLTFQKSATGYYASVIKTKDEIEVPVILYKISEYDEERLDSYEGCPRYYKKHNLKVEDEFGKEIEGIAYILPQDKAYGLPSYKYINLIARAYENFNLDKKVIQEALILTQKESKKEVEIKAKKPVSGELNLFEKVKSVGKVTYNTSKPKTKEIASKIESCQTLNYKNSSRFFDEYSSELLHKYGEMLYTKYDKISDSLEVLSTESQETYYIVYPPDRLGAFLTFSVENVYSHDFVDFSTIAESLRYIGDDLEMSLY